MKKIIFLDLDGTLWTFEKIPGSALEAIELASDSGNLKITNLDRLIFTKNGEFTI